MSDSKLTLEVRLDQGDIGTLIRSELSPAIQAELAKLDLGKMIVEKLTSAPAQADRYLSLFIGGQAVHANLLDELISTAIHAEAKAFIERHLETNRPAIEKRFVEMMQGSEQKLTRSFCDAIVSAIDSADWAFDLDLKVSAAAATEDRS